MSSFLFEGDKLLDELTHKYGKKWFDCMVIFLRNIIIICKL